MHFLSRCRNHEYYLQALRAYFFNTTSEVTSPQLLRFLEAILFHAEQSCLFQTLENTHTQWMEFRDSCTRNFQDSAFS